MVHASHLPSLLHSPERDSPRTQQAPTVDILPRPSSPGFWSLLPFLFLLSFPMPQSTELGGASSAPIFPTRAHCCGGGAKGRCSQPLSKAASPLGTRIFSAPRRSLHHRLGGGPPGTARILSLFLRRAFPSIKPQSPGRTALGSGLWGLGGLEIEWKAFK